MSLVRRRLGSHTYLYFKLPGPSEIYLGPEDRPDYTRVDKAMRYVRGRVRHYETLMEELERLTVIHAEERRRLPETIRPNVEQLAKNLGQSEMGALVRLSLAENGLSPYELERRGVRPREIIPLIRKLSDLGLIDRKSETRTPTGRKLVRYTATDLGARLAFKCFSRTLDEQPTEQKLRSLAEGNFDSTPLGAIYKQMQSVKQFRGEASS